MNLAPRVVRLALVAILLCLAGRIALSAQDSSGITFLHLQIDEGGVRLVGASRAPGTVKPEISRGSIHYEISGGDGSAIWRGGVPDPRYEHFESADALDANRMTPLQVERPVGEFTLRVPAGAAGGMMRFYNTASAETVRAQSRRMVGEFAVPELEGALRSLNTEAQVFMLLTNGPKTERLNIAILAEGFTASEIATFTNKAGGVLEQFLAASPYREYRTHFNGFAVFVPSAESGSDHPSRGIFRDTYFNSSYDSYSLARLITIPPNDRNSNYMDGRGKVFELMERALPDFDIALLLVNDEEYGGSGGVPSIASINRSSAEIAIHEVGHSFAALGDEYDTPFPGYPDTEEPNTTKETRRDMIKWRDWILPSTPIPTQERSTFAAVIGLFEGAHYNPTGWFRPKLDCKMKTLGVAFCEVCREAIVLSAYAKLGGPIQAPSPTIRFATVYLGQTVNFSVETISPADHDLKYTWSVNGLVREGFNGPSFPGSLATIAPGEHTLGVVVEDPTPLVRTDTFQRLKATHSWIVLVEGGGPPPVVTAQAPILLPTGVALRFTSTRAADLSLETSPDLTAWTAIRSLSNAISIEHVAPLGGVGARNFYRVRASVQDPL